MSNTMLRNDNLYYDVFPRVVRVGREVVITVRPRYRHVYFDAEKHYQVRVVPMEGVQRQTRLRELRGESATLDNGILRVAHVFEGEQEYALMVDVTDGTKATPVAEFHLFALRDDLFGRRPFKGDLHMHSSGSDGVESPAYVAGSCRRIGLDFMAVTDHHQYGPSLEAIRAFDDVDIDLRIYPGEEVHPPGNLVHIINFGGRFSINEQFAGEAYQSEVAALAADLMSLPSGMDPYPYASCLWCFDKIREAGGLGIFCHPYWVSGNHYDMPRYLVELLFESQPFDALEVIGGYRLFEVESNALQVARYHDARAQGKRVPIVGVSDAHGCETGELFGWFYSVVFSESSDLPDLVRSVKELYSVAIEALPGQPARAFGPFRLVKYTQYLLTEIFPLHDELCVEEGRLMLAHVADDQQAADSLRLLSGRTSALYDHLWSS